MPVLVYTSSLLTVRVVVAVFSHLRHTCLLSAFQVLGYLMESCFANQIPLELEVVLPPLAPSTGITGVCDHTFFSMLSFLKVATEVIDGYDTTFNIIYSVHFYVLVGISR